MRSEKQDNVSWNENKGLDPQRKTIALARSLSFPWVSCGSVDIPQRVYLPSPGPYRGHYPIVEFEIWPFQPRVKLSLSTMRSLIDIFSRSCCNVAWPAFVRSFVRLLLASSPPLSFSLSFSLSFIPSRFGRLVVPSSSPRRIESPRRSISSCSFLRPAPYKASAEYF